MLNYVVFFLCNVYMKHTFKYGHWSNWLGKEQQIGYVLKDYNCVNIICLLNSFFVFWIAG